MQAQTPQRYRDTVFNDVSIEKDLSYDAAAGEKDQKAYRFDLYQPKDDHNTDRPLIIWMHGGGFKFGSKNDANVERWCKSFTMRGYVCAAINYRKSSENTLFNFDKFLKASYDAIQDLKTAVAFFKTNAVRFHINPNQIILAGNSAGGMIALNAAFGTDAELAKMTKTDSGGTNNNGTVKVAAVINFWGAIYNLDWLSNRKIPIVSVLGSRDRVVPPTHGTAPLYGGIDIHQKADVIGLPNKLKVFEGYSHELAKHFNPIFPASTGTRQRQKEAGQFAADFIYENIIKQAQLY